MGMRVDGACRVDSVKSKKTMPIILIGNATFGR